MNDSESKLVFMSLIFGLTLFVISVVKGPRLTFLSNKAYVDTARLRGFLKFLLIVAVLSIPIGYAVTRLSFVVFKFVGFNVFMGAIMGSSLFLIRERPHTHKINKR